MGSLPRSTATGRARIVIRLAVLGLCSGAFAWLAPASASAAVPGGKVTTVLPSTLLHVTGSDIYCTVLKESGAPAVACFHDPGGASSSVRKGYAIAAEEVFVAVEPSGSTRPSELRRQPAIPKTGVFTGGQARKAIIELALDDLALVGGTHMAIIVTKAQGGGEAAGIVYLDENDDPIVGTDAIGISSHFVTITQVVGPQKTKLVYRHAVY